MKLKSLICVVLGLLLAVAAGPVLAKDTVEVAFIGPLTGGVSAIGVGDETPLIWR